jgi:hypothetical protein
MAAFTLSKLRVAEASALIERLAELKLSRASLDQKRDDRAEGNKQ